MMIELVAMTVGHPYGVRGYFIEICRECFKFQRKTIGWPPTINTTCVLKGALLIGPGIWQTDSTEHGTNNKAVSKL